MGSLPSSLPGAFSLQQAERAGLSRRLVYALVERGELEQLARGTFRRLGAELGPHPELVEIGVRVPMATLCLETALAHHGLSDALVAVPDLALPRGTRRPVTSTAVRWHFFQPETFALGRGSLELDAGAVVGLYSAERSVVDAFRLRGLEGHAVAYEALRRWLHRRGAEPRQLLALAEQLPRATAPLRHALEVLL